MNPHSTPSDERIDALLAARVVSARDNLPEAVLARICSAEADVDSWLASQPVTASEGFADRTLARVRSKPTAHGRESNRTVWLAPLAGWAAAAAVAAVAVLSFVLSPPPLPLPTGDDARVAAVERTDAAGSAAAPWSASFEEEPIALVPESAPESTEDLILAEIFVLADGLTDAATLLDDENVETLAFFAE